MPRSLALIFTFVALAVGATTALGEMGAESLPDINPIIDPLLPADQSPGLDGASSDGYGSFDVFQCAPPPALDAESFESGTTLFNLGNSCNAQGGNIHVIGDGSGQTIANGATGNWHYIAPSGTGFAAISVTGMLHDRNSQNSKIEVENAAGANHVDIATGGAGDINDSTITWSRGSGVRRTIFREALRCVGTLGCANPSSNRALVQIRQILLTVEDYTVPTVSASGSLLTSGPRAGTQTLSFSGQDQGGGVRNSEVVVNGTTLSPKTYSCLLLNASTAERLSPCPASVSESYSYNTQQSPFHEGQNTVSTCLEDFDQSADGNRGCYDRTVTIDNTPPQTTIDSGAQGATNDSTPTFTFSASESGSSYECRIDAGAFQSCSSPFTSSTLTDGSHSFDVRATDQAGNLDTTPATRSFTVDTAAPQTTIDSGPQGATNDSTPTFFFSASESGSTFKCRIDAGAFASCSSPFTSSALTDRAHTFEVRATDPVGNPDGTPANRSFTVDTAAPQTTIDSGPQGPTSNASPSFAFSASEGGSSFECRIDAGAWQSCTSPKSYTGLADGSHSFEVRATDPVGNTDATPAIRSFTVDTAAPQTTIDSGPSGITSDTTASFSFSASESSSSFECRIDAGAWQGCGSPKSYTGLADGSHTFEVRAIDPAGNSDATPANRDWTVDSGGLRAGVATRSIKPQDGSMATHVGGFDTCQGCPTTAVHPGDDLKTRAMVIRRGNQAVVVGAADLEGWFAGYKQGPQLGLNDLRADVAAELSRPVSQGGLGLSMGAKDIIFQSTHCHACPSVVGIWGATNLNYLRYVYAQTKAAIIDAASNAQVARLGWTKSDIGYINDVVIPQANANEGWPKDGQLAVLHAVNRNSGATIGTYATVPAHDNIVYGPAFGDMSSGYFGVADRWLEQRLGGVAIVAPGTLGDQVTPEQGNADSDAFQVIDRLGALVGSSVLRSLSADEHIVPADAQLGGVETYVLAPTTNPAFGGANCVGTISQTLESAPDRSCDPPYAASSGAIGAWFTALRIGSVAIASEPGEAFPHVSWAIRRTISGASVVFTPGQAQDQLGYYYEPWAFPTTPLYSSEHHLVSYSQALAEENIQAHLKNARDLGFAVTPTAADPTGNDYARVTRHGVQVWGYPQAQGTPAPSGTRIWIGVYRGTSRLNQETEGERVPDPIVTFGDGSPPQTLSSPPGVRRCCINVEHTFPGPGDYEVTASLSGTTETWRTTVHITDPFTVTNTAHYPDGQLIF